MIRTEQLHKSYGNVQALRGIDLSVERGDVYGIIGPDGAGKTTLFRILASLIKADSGKATLDGLDVQKAYKQVRKIIGYMPGKFSLYQDLSVEENLQFFATIFNTTIQENYHLIKDIYQQIEPFKDRKAGALSGGMKQKLALSCALIHKPKVLILDESTTGVDPVSRKEFWDMLGRLKQEGITIVVSTAYMDEASRCDKIALMKDGQFIATNTPQGIINAYTKTLWAISSANMSKLLRDVREIDGVQTAFAFGDKHHITTVPSLQQEHLLAQLKAAGHPDSVVERILPTIEDCFLELANTPHQ